MTVRRTRERRRAGAAEGSPETRDPRLPAALMRSSQGACSSLRLFAYVMVRHALRRVGEEDRVLADYATSILDRKSVV